MDGILSFSTAPSAIAGTIGMLLLFAAMVAGISSLLSGHGLIGIPLVICLILGLNGVQMLFLSCTRSVYVKGIYGKQTPSHLYRKEEGRILKRRSAPAGKRSLHFPAEG